jgi:hypothetical protein
MSGWVKPKTMKFVCVASPLNTQHKGVRSKTGWFGVRMCPSGATCLPCRTLVLFPSHGNDE